MNWLLSHDEKKRGCSQHPIFILSLISVDAFKVSTLPFLTESDQNRKLITIGAYKATVMM